MKMKLCSNVLVIALITICTYSFGQAIEPFKYNQLFTAGYAHAFIGGLYDGYYPYRQLKLHGDFGLGAPDKLDGELLILNGKLYKTQSTGKTSELSYSGKTPYAVVNFFKADQQFKIKHTIGKDTFYKYLDSVLSNKNGMYAIHVKGLFKALQTRAFPQVSVKPYAALSAMLSLQHFFTFENIEGDLVGYKLPEYMDGANITGYHFHFLSADKSRGGHIIDFTAENVLIEIDSLNSFTVDIPQTADFNNYNFKADRTEELKSVENGKTADK